MKQLDGRSTLLRGQQRVAQALLTSVDGSAPLPPGATMLVSDDGGIEGSITGGCIESALVQEAELLLRRSGAPKELTYGISDELAGTVGLMCGGTVDVFLHELDAAARELTACVLDAMSDGRPAALATLLDGPAAGGMLALLDDRVLGSFGGPVLLDRSVARDLRGLLAHGITTIRRYGGDGAALGADLRVHVRAFAPAPRMLIVGAIDFSAALAPLAAELGYDVTICDPRERFLRSSRFSRSATAIVAWPQELIPRLALTPRDAVLVFTHDPKVDEPALLSALTSAAGYVGALGSRRTTIERNARLAAAGASEAELARLRAPCGLDLGGQTPGETAISVLAEIVAARTGRSAAPLTGGAGAIHAPAVRAPHGGTHAGPGGR